MSEKNTDNEQPLVTPQTKRLLWIIFGLMLAGTVVAEFFVKHKPYFGLDGEFGFSIWFGLIASAVIALGAKVLGALLKRPDTYYDS